MIKNNSNIKKYRKIYFRERILAQSGDPDSGQYLITNPNTISNKDWNILESKFFGLYVENEKKKFVTKNGLNFLQSQEYILQACKSEKALKIQEQMRKKQNSLKRLQAKLLAKLQAIKPIDPLSIKIQAEYQKTEEFFQSIKSPENIAECIKIIKSKFPNSFQMKGSFTIKNWHVLGYRIVFSKENAIFHCYEKFIYMDKEDDRIFFFHPNIIWFTTQSRNFSNCIRVWKNSKYISNHSVQELISQMDHPKSINDAYLAYERLKYNFTHKIIPIDSQDRQIFEELYSR